MSFKIFKESKSGWKKNDRLPEYLEMLAALEQSPNSYAVTDIDRQHMYYLMRRTGTALFTKDLGNGKTEVWIPRDGEKHVASWHPKQPAPVHKSDKE